MLNLNKAVKLYEILKPHIPSNDKQISSLKYIQYIIENIKNENPSDYVDSIMIMHNITLDELKEKDSDEVLNLFIEGLSENKFVSLCEFIGSFGNGKRKSG